MNSNDQIEYYFVGFLMGNKINLGVLEISCTSQKNNYQNDLTRPEIGKKLKNSKIYKIEYLPSRILWKHMKRIWEKYGEIRKDIKN